MKLNILIIISFIVVGIIISFVAGALYYYNSLSNVENEISNNMLAIAESRAEHINTYFSDEIEKEKLISSRTQLKLDIENYLNAPSQELKEAIKIKLNDSKNSVDEYDYVCFINLEGKIVTCDDSSLSDKDFSKEDFFINGLKTEGAYFFNDNPASELAASGPIIQNGKLMGVILTLANLNELGDIVKDRTGLGKTGEVLVAYLNDENGQITYPFQRLFTTTTTTTTTTTRELMKQALFGNEIIYTDVLDYRNVHVIAATQYIDIADMGLVAKVDRSEVISSYQTALLKILGVIGVIIIFISGFAGFFLMQRIGKPLGQLRSATEEIQKGNLKARVNIQSGDEIEELGNSFNKTAEILENLDKEREGIDKAKTEFLSITSHELRSPMTPMKAQLQMILGNYFGKITKEQRESLNIVLNNTERLDKIIVDFLEISRIEAARLKFNFVKADLTKTIDSVIDEMKGFMPEKKINIVTHVDKLPIIEVDPDRVSQVLRNLVNNAIKFSPANSKVEVFAKLHGQMILFSVQDSGVGISEKDQRKLFEPFYQVENMYQHKSGGTGLGLAISRGIVESQNGKIWLASQLGKGTIFYFTVPLKPIREMKAIRLLFSDSTKTDEILKSIFKEYLGPLGDKEFENLKESKGITFDFVKEYIHDLVRKGIFQKDSAEEFKNRVGLVLNRGEKEENNER